MKHSSLLPLLLLIIALSGCIAPEPDPEPVQPAAGPDAREGGSQPSTPPAEPSGSSETASYTLTIYGTAPALGVVRVVDNGKITHVCREFPCSYSLRAGSAITLEAYKKEYGRFVGWGGDCSGAAASCALNMNSGKTAYAAFAILEGGAPSTSSTMVVAGFGSGSGIITSSPSGIDCGSACSKPYPWGTQIILTATPSANSVFAGWGADCSGLSSSCTLSMDKGSKVAGAWFISK